MDSEESWGKTPAWLFFCFLLLKSRPWWRVAALIVLSVFVVYFSYFIGWGSVCGGVSRGEAPDCPLDVVLHQWCAISLSAVDAVAPQDRPSPVLLRPWEHRCVWIRTSSSSALWNVKMCIINLRCYFNKIFCGLYICGFCKGNREAGDLYKALVY